MHVLERGTIIKESIEVLWEFFSNPGNLNRITPPDMSFEILTDVGGRSMHPGMIIRYKVRPLANIPMKWVTEITHCETHVSFVDEQRFGPYRFWHHQHHFTELGDGRVYMQDIVHYDAGFGPLGRAMNALYIKKRLEGIFDYRTTAISELFEAEAAPVQGSMASNKVEM